MRLSIPIPRLLITLFALALAQLVITVLAALFPAAMGTASWLLASAASVAIAAGIASLFRRTRALSSDLTSARMQAQAILDTAVDGIITIDERGIVLSANRAAETLFGYAANELIGQNISTIMPSPDCESHDQYIRNYLATGERKIIGRGREVTGRTRHGKLIPLHISVSEAWVEGDRRFFAGIIHDISDRKQVESDIERRAHQQAMVAQLGRRALSGVSLDRLMSEAVHVVADVLDADFTKILQLDASGDSFLLRTGVGWKEGRVGSARIVNDETVQAGFTLRSKAPVIVADLRTESRFSSPPLLVEHEVTSGISVPIYGNSRPFGVFGVHTKAPRDFSVDDSHFVQSVANVIAEAVAHRETQSHLIQQENLARLGSMAAVVAHEVKNPLAGISGAVQVIGSQLPSDSPNLPVIHEIIGRIEGLNNAIEDILLFARPKTPDKAPIPMRTLIASTVPLFKSDQSFKGLEVEVLGDDPTVRGDAQLLKRVFLNLLVNSGQAMDHDGKITVRVSADGDRCAISVIDNGTGIPPDISARLFEPFVTSKARGSGLGLPAAQQIITAHKGEIRLKRTGPEGTEFVVELPVAGHDETGG